MNKNDVIEKLIELLDYKDREIEKIKKEKVRDNFIPVVTDPNVPKNTIILSNFADVPTYTSDGTNT